METSNLTKKRIVDFLSEGKRFDKRDLLEYRDVVIETGISKNAEGSARVRLGNTEIIAGVKLDVSEPYPDSQDQGTLITTVELTPTSSPKFEPGPPRIEAIETARIVDRGIRESGFIDFSKLCIKEGEKVWGVYLDLYSINNDGNLLDASCIAAIAALLSAKMPKYDSEKEKVVFGEITDEPLPLSSQIPITITFHKIGNSLIVDPTTDEESTSEGRISIAISELNKKPVVNAIQKGEEIVLSKEELFDVIDKAVKVWETQKKLISDSLKLKSKK